MSHSCLINSRFKAAYPSYLSVWLCMHLCFCVSILLEIHDWKSSPADLTMWLGKKSCCFFSFLAEFLGLLFWMLSSCYWCIILWYGWVLYCTATASDQSQLVWEHQFFFTLTVLGTKFFWVQIKTAYFYLRCFLTFFRPSRVTPHHVWEYLQFD